MTNYLAGGTVFVDLASARTQLAVDIFVTTDERVPSPDVGYFKGEPWTCHGQFAGPDFINVVLDVKPLGAAETKLWIGGSGDLYARSRGFTIGAGKSKQEIILKAAYDDDQNLFLLKH